MQDYLGASAQIPYRSYSEIEQEASTFLEDHWGGQFPVEVDEICDDLGIGIIYIPGLKRQFGLDSYATSDFKTIVLDEKTALENENRYRFSIAHELGHIILHKEYYPSNINDVETYLRYAPGYINGPAENQANMFAGVLLVPTADLRKSLMEFFEIEIYESRLIHNKSQVAGIFSQLTKKFGVSNETLIRRIKTSFPDLLEILSKEESN